MLLSLRGSAISATDTILLKLKATILQRTTANNPITLKFTSFVFNTGSPTVATFDGSIYTVNRKPTIVATPKPAAINAGSALTITVAVADSDRRIFSIICSKYPNWRYCCSSL